MAVAIPAAVKCINIRDIPPPGGCKLLGNGDCEGATLYTQTEKMRFSAEILRNEYL